MKLRPFSLLLVALLGACVGANIAVNRNFDFSKVRRVAVIGFKDYPGRPGSGDVVAGAFEQSLLNAGYDLVERAQVAQVLKERRFSGSIDPKAARAYGEKLGVDALLFGQVTDLSESKDRIINAEVVDDRQDPVYVTRTRTVQQPDGTAREVSEDVISGYKTTHIIRREPRRETIDGRLGVSARMVAVADGSVLWSGSDSTVAYSFQDAARSLSDDILKAVKATWPKK